MPSKKREDVELPGEGAWTFETADVARNFDAHVRTQLPWYDFVAKGLVHVATHYVAEGGSVIDVGASTGNVYKELRPLLDMRRARLFAVEKSAEMAKEHRGRYPGVPVWEEDAADVEWAKKDKSDLIVAFLTIMFVPPRRRRKLLEDMFGAIAPGGALVVVDRTALASGYASQVLNRLTLAGKVAAKVPAEEIVAKELSLSGVQRPLDLLDLPGEPVEFFRFGDFAGWLIERKPS